MSPKFPRPYRVDYYGMYRQRATTYATDTAAEAAVEQFFASESAQECRDPHCSLTRYDDETGEVVWIKTARQRAGITELELTYERRAK